MSNTVAILLATYNGESYLAEQLYSIEHQTYKEWHLFISDDGSCDATKEMLWQFRERYPERVFILSPKMPSGSAKSNFFYLMTHVPSGYKGYCFCDQDDYWYPNKIEAEISLLQTLENDDPSKPCLVFCDAKVTDNERNVIDESFFQYTDVDPDRTQTADLLVQNPISGAEIMINESLLMLSIAPSSLDNIDMHDQWIGLVASIFGKIDYINIPLFDYRQHQNNVVGAEEMKISKVFRKAKIAKKSLYTKERQAGCAYETYHNLMESDIKRLLLEFAEIRNVRKIDRIKYLITNRIRMNGFLRNVGLYVFI